MQLSARVILEYEKFKTMFVYICTRNNMPYNNENPCL